MAVRLIKRAWWVDLTFNHTRYRKRSPLNSKSGAQAYEITLRQRLARGEPIADYDESSAQPQTFETFARSWLETYVIPNNKVSEQRSKNSILASSLVPFFGKLPVSRITTHHIEQFKAHSIKEGVGNKTIKNRLTVLNTCLKCAYDWLQLSGAPPKIAWPKYLSQRTDFLTPQECDLLLSHAYGAIREMILMALRSGMRQGELKGLQWSSIDWLNRSVAVRHSHCDRLKGLVSPKSNRERHIPLDAEVYDALARRRQSAGYVFTTPQRRPFDSMRLIRQLETVCHAAGVRRVTWHTLRHTFATHLAMKGVPIPTVQALLGHSSITTTMKYAHVAPSTLRTAIEMLSSANLSRQTLGQPAVNQWLMTQQHVASQQLATPKTPGMAG